MKYRVEGYFSTEAALVFPVVIGTILLLIYLGFYQYDRCRLEFDVAGIALAGCSCDDEDWAVVLGEMEKAAAELSEERYIAWEVEGINVKVDGRRVHASGVGKLRFPFGFLIQKGMEGTWKTEVIYENRRLNPVKIVRWYNKIVGGD